MFVNLNEMKQTPHDIYRMLRSRYSHKALVLINFSRRNGKSSFQYNLCQFALFVWFVMFAEVFHCKQVSYHILTNIEVIW